MANEYVTKDEVKAFIGRASTDKDGLITRFTTDASRWLDGKCGRRFYADTNASTRVFHPLTCHKVMIDDALEITTVETDDADDGNYSTTWASTDYQKLPLNNIGPNGLSGWPTTALEAIEARDFPIWHRRASVRVTAKWGWSSTPAEVKEACMFYVHRLLFLSGTPGGVVESAEFGGQPVRSLRDIEEMLTPYKTTLASDGRFLVG